MSGQSEHPDQTEAIHNANADENTFAPVKRIALSEIDDSDRLRPVDRDAAKAIAASIARDGLLTPIDVCQMPGRKGFRLVAGGHRLAAVRLLGWTEIPAFVRSANALDRKAREIAENIFTAGLSPLDRATFVAELYTLEKERCGLSYEDDPRKAGANARWQKELKNQASNATGTMTVAFGFTNTVAEKIGLSEWSIRRDLLLFKRLTPEVAALARGSKIGSNATALRQVAALEPKEQKRVIDLLCHGPYSVSQAIGIVRNKRVAPPETKRLSTFLDTFSRMGRKEKLLALRELSQHLPKGVRLNGVNESLMTDGEVMAIATAAGKMAAE